MLQIGTIGAIACLVGIGVTFYSWEETMNYDLSLVSVDDSSALPETGESQVIIARTGDDLHVRIFDDNGNRAVDKSEDVLSGGQTISELKELLKTDPLPDISQWKKEERQEVIQKAAAVSGRTHVMLIVLMCAFRRLLPGAHQVHLRLGGFSHQYPFACHVDRDFDHVADRHPGRSVYPGVA